MPRISPIVSKRAPRHNGAIIYADALIGDESFYVNFRSGSEAIAIMAHTYGGIKAKTIGLKVLETDIAMVAIQMFTEKHFFKRGLFIAFDRWCD